MKDPFGDYRELRDRHGIWTLKHTIYQQLSIFNLPYPYHDCSSLHFRVHFVHFQHRCAWWLQCFPQIFDSTCLINGTSNQGNVPVKEIIKLLSYKTGKIPFLNLVSQSIMETYTLPSSFYNNSFILSGHQDFENLKKDAKKRSKVRAKA